MLFHSMTPSSVAAAPKALRRYAGNGAAHARVGKRKIRIGEIRLASAYRQRLNELTPAAMHIHHMNVRDVDHVHAIEAASVPWIERIMRAHREPANRSKT